MLKDLQLLNFRGFRNHRIPLRELTIAVGRNNAGKSTIVEALRLVALASNRHQTMGYRRAPRWLDAPLGVQPAIDDLQLMEMGLFNGYGDPPAAIKARFSNGLRLDLFLRSATELHSVLRPARGSAARSPSEAVSMGLETVAVLPQVAPLSASEVRLSPEYIRRSASGRLAPSHFRNQLVVFADRMTRFRAMVEDTWPGLQVLELDVPRYGEEGSLLLRIRNQDFVGEAVAMGHGVQMWLQVIWFLAREESAATLILDEPDVYMHADLQRRLVRLLRRLPRQVILTSHSSEVMAEVEPENILIVERNGRASTFADSIPAVQRIVEAVGSTQNIHFARIIRARKFLIVEGDDLRILKILQDKLFPESLEPLDAVPNITVGGWGGWQRAIGSSMTLESPSGEAIRVFCIFDSDFHSELQIEERQRQAVENGVFLHIWRRKELENYLIAPGAIARIIGSHVPNAAVDLEGVVGNAITVEAQALENETFDAFATEALTRDRSLGVSGANSRARETLAARRAVSGHLAEVVSGKQLIARLSEWSQQEFGVSLSPMQLAKALLPSEVPNEMREVLAAIEEVRPFG